VLADNLRRVAKDIGHLFEAGTAAEQFRGQRVAARSDETPFQENQRESSLP
jgi:hypothetical protein